MLQLTTESGFGLSHARRSKMTRASELRQNFGHATKTAIAPAHFVLFATLREEIFFFFEVREDSLREDSPREDIFYLEKNPREESKRRNQEKKPREETKRRNQEKNPREETT